MLDKCLNPECSEPFLYLHVGRLFRFERQPHSNISAPEPAAVLGRNSWEFFWLCENCAGRYTLLMQPDGTIEMVARLPKKTVALRPQKKRKSA